MKLALRCVRGDSGHLSGHCGLDRGGTAQHVRSVSMSAFCTADVPAGLLGNNDPDSLSIRVEASSSRNHFAGAKVGKSLRRGCS